MGHELLALISRLSGAATRERSAAVDEMQRLRKKVIQQQTDIKRLGSSSQQAQSPAQLPQTHQMAQATKPPRAPQAPMVAGYGNFNQERLLAIQAASDAQADPSSSGLPYHPLMDNSSSKVTKPTPSATAANTMPLGPREKVSRDDHKAHDGKVDELVRTLRATTTSPALEHKRSGSDMPGESSKKRKLDIAPVPQSALSLVHPAAKLLSAARGSFSCVRCICERVVCDGASHCTYYRTSATKCVYLLCAKNRQCDTLDCKLIHKWQYNESQRKRGQPRRHVLGDTVHSEALAQSVVDQLSKAQVLLVGPSAVESNASMLTIRQHTDESSGQADSQGGFATAGNSSASTHRREGSPEASAYGAPVIKSEGP